MSAKFNYSIKLFEEIAFAYSDTNIDGVLDEKEQENYNIFIKQFDMDKKDGITNEDVFLYQQSVEYTPEEEEFAKKQDEFCEKWLSDERALYRDCKEKTDESTALNNLPGAKTYPAKLKKSVEHSKMMKKLCDYTNALYSKYDEYIKQFDENPDILNDKNFKQINDKFTESCDALKSAVTKD